MAVSKKITLKSLSDADLRQIENDVLKLESLQRRNDTAKAKINRSKQGGLFSPSELREALPTSVINKRRKLDNTVSEFARSEDSKNAKGTLSNGKIRPEDEDLGIVGGFISSLGIKQERKTAKNSLVSTAGRPVRSFDNEFTKLRTRTQRLEQQQSALARIISKGDALIAGASGITSVQGITSVGLNALGNIPLVGFVASIAVGVAAKLWDENVRRFRDGGTRDRRKKVLAGDASLIGIDNENAIFSGENLFFSNPQSLQGLPKGKSNTAELRDGIARYNQRHSGSYD